MSETLDLNAGAGTATVAKIKKVIEEFDEKKETLKVTWLKVIVATTNFHRLLRRRRWSPNGPLIWCSYDLPAWQTRISRR